MNTNRGRSRKGSATDLTRINLPGAKALTRERMEKLYKWQRFTNKQREAYGYNFEKYVKE